MVKTKTSSDNPYGGSVRDNLQKNKEEKRREKDEVVDDFRIKLLRPRKLDIQPL